AAVCRLERRTGASYALQERLPHWGLYPPWSGSGRWLGLSGGADLAEKALIPSGLWAEPGVRRCGQLDATPFLRLKRLAARLPFRWGVQPGAHIGEKAVP